jgi:hypothetical protein
MPVPSCVRCATRSATDALSGYVAPDRGTDQRTENRKHAGLARRPVARGPRDQRLGNDRVFLRSVRQVADWPDRHHRSHGGAGAAYAARRRKLHRPTGDKVPVSDRCAVCRSTCARSARRRRSSSCRLRRSRCDALHARPAIGGRGTGSRRKDHAALTPTRPPLIVPEATDRAAHAPALPRPRRAAAHRAETGRTQSGSAA